MAAPKSSFTQRVGGISEIGFPIGVGMPAHYTPQLKLTKQQAAKLASELTKNKHLV